MSCLAAIQESGRMVERISAVRAGGIPRKGGLGVGGGGIDAALLLLRGFRHLHFCACCRYGPKFEDSLGIVA